jgi:AGZA family xanthine/uracil permease-like MFS transporter
MTPTILAVALGLNEFKGVVGQIPSIAPTFMQMDFEGLFTASVCK